MTRGRAATRNTVDTSNEYLGAAPTVSANNIQRGDVEEIITDAGKSVAEHEAFMQDVLSIVVQSSGNDNETRMVYVSVNGRPIMLPRDEPVQVKRSYVEVLARCKKTDFDQKIDERLGEGMNNVFPRHSLKHPFTVVSDPAGVRGHEWLRGILAQRR